MAANALDSKIQTTFNELAVDKGLIRRMGLAGDDRHVPSYVMDWIVTRHLAESSSTTTLQKTVQDFVQEHLPPKRDKERVKFKLGRGERLVLLDEISVRVKLRADVEYLATIPCLDEKAALIDEKIIEEHEGLLQGATWGAVKIVYDHDGGDRAIRIIDFKPMQTGRISLAAYLECRKAFTVEEWIDVIVRTLGYEPGGYSEREKLWMLCRLAPVVHNRVNMMELAPPGSGKSYVYNNVSRHVWLTAAEISPAVLFYNRQSKMPGLLTRYDLLVLDEAQSIRFTNAAEIQAQLKGYLEQGVYARGDCCATAECGLMLLANIDLTKDTQEVYSNGKPRLSPARSDFIRRLASVFHESPLVDRFHGLLPGWEIPPFTTNQQADGFGLKADYFAEVCHSLRSASHIAQRVRAKLHLSGGKRDCTAIERLACGLSKILLIEPDHPRFEELIVAPAHELRRLVRTQLHELDPQGYDADLEVTGLGVSRSSYDSLGRIGSYELLEQIGTGGMANVFKAIDTESDALVAVKMVKVADVSQNEAAIRREIEIYKRLREVDNENILRVLDVFQSAEAYALVTEFADGGSLWDLGLASDPEGDKERKVLEEGIVKGVALAILAGLVALHENGIVHRDIKPQNILRCDDSWKIADFGISKFVRKPVTGYTFQGAHSAPWAPPEQIEGAEAHPSADVYACGRTIGFLLTGSEKKADTLGVAGHWGDILAACVEVDPKRRPDAASVRDQIADLSL